MRININNINCLITSVLAGVAATFNIAFADASHFECSFPNHPLNASTRNIEFDVTPDKAPTEGTIGGIAYLSRRTPLEKQFRFMIIHQNSPDLGKSTMIVPDIIQEKNNKLSPQIHIHIFGKHFLPGGDELTSGTGIATVGEAVPGNKNNLILILDTANARCL